MADTKISGLAAGAPAQAGDLIPIARSGANYSITPANILAYGSSPVAGTTGTFTGALSATTGTFSSNLAVTGDTTTTGYFRTDGGKSIFGGWYGTFFSATSSTGSYSKTAGIYATAQGTAGGTNTLMVAINAGTNTANSSTVTTCVGLLVDNQTAGSTNYAIKTGTGLVDFGGNTSVTGTLSATSNAAFGTSGGDSTIKLGPTASEAQIKYNNSSGNLEINPRASFSTLITAGGLAVTGTLSSTGNFAVNTNKFTVNASTGSVLSKYINVSLAGTEGTLLQLWDDTLINCVTLTSVSTGGASGAATCISSNRNSSTSRSINAAGTINASGADYAEYERNNGLTITKGSIVGFKSDGTLTLTFSEAVRFGVKSTSPSYVGGDTWGNEDAVGERPVMPRDPTDEQKAQHATDTEAFNVRLEAARQQVDRIAYSGKVPCNVMGAAPGDYIIAAEDGNAIAGKAIANPTFEQYRNAVGRVNKILSDGRAEIAVIVH